MSETDLSMRRILTFAAVVETGTGIALMIAPAMVVALLVRAESSVLGTLLGRCFGIGLLALGMACWPERQRAERSSAAFRAMFTYNGLIALFLGYVGAVVHLGGPLLWPAVALHGVVAVLLVWMRRDE
jgi:Ca2+/Na+ antiporter